MAFQTKVDAGYFHRSTALAHPQRRGNSPPKDNSFQKVIPTDDN
jgi:hypothetical protein